MACLYKLREVRKSKSKGGAVFSLEVPELCLEIGTRVVVTGPSGCGKSTLLDLLGLIALPDRAGDFTLQIPQMGTVALFPSPDDDLCAGVRRTCFGYILQQGGLIPYLTVQENLELPVKILGRVPDSAWFRRIVDTLDLGSQLAKLPQFLSVGQRQRVSVARAVMHRPALLLADEPTAALDQENARRVRDLILDLSRESGATVVFVTHDVDLIEGSFDARITFTLSRSEQEVVQAVASLHACET